MENALKKLKKSINEKGEITKIPIIEEKPLTLYLNNQEIVTIMTIGDYPKYLAIGYLFNQGMLNNIDDVKKIEFHKDLKTVVVRTKSKTNYEEKLKKKVNTSGCAQGTVFGDLFEITSEPNELFYSTATVDNIEIINSFTDQNLKKGS